MRSRRHHSTLPDSATLAGLRGRLAARAAAAQVAIAVHLAAHRGYVAWSGGVVAVCRALLWRAGGDPDRVGHLDGDERLARPSPPACAARLGVVAPLLATAGLRPPYRHPRRQRELAIPQPLDEEHDATLQRP